MRVATVGAPRVVWHLAHAAAALPGEFAPPAWRELRHDLDAAAVERGDRLRLPQPAAARVDAVLASDVLVWLAPHAVTRLLEAFARALRPLGLLRVVVPDVQAAAERVAAGDLHGPLASPAHASAAALLWGDAVAHRCGFSAATLQRCLAAAGFEGVRVERRSAHCELVANAWRPHADAHIGALFAAADAAYAERRWRDAEGLYTQVTAADPAHAPAWTQRSAVAFRLGQWQEAAAHARRALQLQPQQARAVMLLGTVLAEGESPADALPHLRHAVALDPQSCEAHFRLGLALQRVEDRAAAEASFREALRLEPQHALARLNLAHALFAQWRDAEALPLYRDAASHIADPLVQSNLLMQLNWSATSSDAEVHAAHEDFDRRLVAPRVAAAAPHTNRPDPARRLRLAYLSRDFNRHSLRYFLIPIVAHHDRGAFELFFYAIGGAADEVTATYRTQADHWVDAGDLDDDALAARLRADGIDIVVDLAGHTDRNRMLALAIRPAPVQIAYLGYPATTGASCFDFRISDRFVDPETPALPTSERPLRLEHGYFCYEPLADSPAVGERPALRRGHLTFGSLNQAPKLNPPLLRAWAEIVQRVPGSRLMIQNKAAGHAAARARWLAELARAGLDPAQVECRPNAPAPDYLRSCHDIDIALDSFPYNGGTTTCELLWMGVPVVSRCGGRHVSRLGASVLGALGLSDLVAADEAGYVATALRLAADPKRLQALRTGLRERMRASPLMDHAGFTRELESAYRQAWSEWCARQRAGVVA